MDTFNTLDGESPIVIGHRGAAGSRPEHTLASYAYAIENGADFIEPDTVVTKDGVLICRHEPLLAIVQLDDSGNIVLDDEGNPIVTEETTNVADKPEFADLLTVKELDGALVGGWFAEDFTLDEIKTLLARERIPDVRPDNTAYNDLYEIPTLAEVIQLVKDVEAETGREIGIYPETKHPTFFENQGVDTSQLLIDTLVAEDFTDPDRIFIQSFEFANLIRLQSEIMPAAGVDIPLIQLYGDFTDPAAGGFDQPYDIRANVLAGNDLDAIYGETFVDTVEAANDGEPISTETGYGDLAKPEVLQAIADLYAEGIGPWNNTIIPRDASGNQLEPTALIEDAHAAGLELHPYTYRVENTFLPTELRDGWATDPNPEGLIEQIQTFIQLGVDGFFTDNTPEGVAAVEQAEAADFLGTLEGDTYLAGSGAQIILGLGGDDTLGGGSGDDEIVGGSGNDLVSGGSGNDSLSGGLGDDGLSGGSGDDLLKPGTGEGSNNGGSGVDTVVYSDLIQQAVVVDLTSGEADLVTPTMMMGQNGFATAALFTVGETIGGYTPPGILDGIGAYTLDDDTVRIFVNHEFSADEEVASYTVNDGALELVGARVSYFDISTTTMQVEDAGLAYDAIYDRNGDLMVDGEQFNISGANELNFDDATGLYGFSRFCSSAMFEASSFGDGQGLADRVYLTGEETDGGTEWAIDVNSGEIWAVPMMGRGNWENITLLDTGTTDKVAFLMGDDAQGRPLTLYVGEKGALGNGSFLDNNGLAQGTTYMWRSLTGETLPSELTVPGESLDGEWVAVPNYDPAKAGMEGYDADGYLTQDGLKAFQIAVGAYEFSRPEDVSTNPEDGTQVVLASTGRSQFDNGADSWGTVYTIDVDFDGAGDPTGANVKVLYNGDLDTEDRALRSPDNVDWSDNGYIYVQEDRSFDEFGQAPNTNEASIIRLDPNAVGGDPLQVGEMDRSAVVPAGTTDIAPDDLGNWESSGILDVSELFGYDAGELFLFDVQAHSLRGGVLEAENLNQGGQLLFLYGPDYDGPTDPTAEIQTLTGIENVTGTKFSDTIVGNSLDNILAGGDGSDFVWANAGNDQITGGDGDDSLYGSSGDDQMDGGAGNDDLYGQDGDDLVEGGSGDDNLQGNGGDDNLAGGDGDDVLIGGSDDDVFAGGQGDDYLVGGSGDDTFVFASGDGVDQIQDFQDDDLIVLVGFDFDSFDDVSPLFHFNDNGSTTIVLGDGDAIRLNDIAPDDLSAGNFQLVA